MTAPKNAEMRRADNGVSDSLFSIQPPHPHPCLGSVGSPQPVLVYPSQETYYILTGIVWKQTIHAAYMLVYRFFPKLKNAFLYLATFCLSQKMGLMNCYF